MKHKIPFIGLGKPLALASAGLLVGGLVLVPSESRADRSSRGSVRHSSTTTRRGTTTRTTATRTTARRAGAPAGRASARAGYRAGYRHGSYHGWNNAWNDYRRWRAITGLFKLGVVMATKPKTTTTVVVTGTTYYYSGGVYFVQSGSNYVVVAPPTGAVVYSVPASTTVVYMGSTPYYYYGGTYYVTTTTHAEAPPPPSTTQASTTTAASSGGEQSLEDVPMIEGEENENFEVVDAPIGATVPYLSDEAKETTVGGKKYYVYDDTYYRPFASDGETIYMVVEDPTKAA